MVQWNCSGSLILDPEFAVHCGPTQECKCLHAAPGANAPISSRMWLCRATIDSVNNSHNGIIISRYYIFY